MGTGATVMDKASKQIQEQYHFLASEHGCRIVETHRTDAFGGNGFVVFANRSLRIKIVLDRDQVYGEIQPAEGVSKSHWHGLDVVYQLIVGKPPVGGLLDARLVTFLKENFVEIAAAFEANRRQGTVEQLRILEAARAERIFG